MPETFLILLCGGVMLAAAVSSTRQVTVHWLRLCGILALCFAGLAVFFVLRREPLAGVSEVYRRVQCGLLLGTIAMVLGQLAFVQTLFLRMQRLCAGIAFLFAVMFGTGLLHEMIPPSAIGKPLAIALQTLGCAGVGAACGVALMDMLLGHAYLTAQRMTIAPFRRLNLVLGAVLVARVISSTVAVAIQWRFPIELFWTRFSLTIATRWFVGLLVPAIFVYMAHDCIRRRSTQSATGILYVAGVLIFIGELVALYLLRETGLPL
jgi:hypothetical protein